MGTFNIAAGIITARWRELGVDATVSRVREHSDGRLTAEIRFRDVSRIPHHVLCTEHLNLLASQSKSRLANDLEGLHPIMMWRQLLDELCTHTIEYHRQGEPIQELSTITEPIKPEYLLHPFLPKGKPTVIYGLGGAGKSYLSLLMGIAVLLPWKENRLGWTLTDDSVKILYLDFETDYHDLQWRLHCLKRGLKLPDVFMQYRRCYSTLANDIESINQIVAENDIGLVIVDSAAAACGGDLFAPDQPIRMFNALRQLNVTSLVIAHTAKGTGANGNQNGSTPYGSVFFTNYARSVWEIKKVQDAGEDIINVGLYHRKVNQGRLFSAQGYSIRFGEDSTSVVRQELAEVVDLATSLSGPERVKAALRHGKMTTSALVERLELPEGTVKSALSRLSRKEVVFKLPSNEWALTANDNF